MTGSINTNIAAYTAQSNINRANNSTSSSIARLSSGNRIVRASDDVAALSTGTSLRTSVTSLRQALLNTSQGSSLLQVADGALGQVVDILQRQKALAVQAGSGSLSDTDRSFLNQEFIALRDEIDRLADGTRFSSVNLLNGSLSGSTPVTTNSNNGINTANATAGNAFVIATPANNDQISVNGVTVTFTTSAPGTSAAAGRVSVGASAADTAANLVAFLNNNADPRLANLVFANAGANITVNNAGGTLAGATIFNASSLVGTNVTVGTLANRTIAVVANSDGLGVDRTKAIGEISGSLLANGGTSATSAGPALVTRAIEDNADFIGKLGEGALGRIEGTFTALDTATFSLKVGEFTYSTVATVISGGAAPIALTFTGRDAAGAVAGGSFVINLRGGSFGVGTLTGQAQIDPVVNQINDSLSGVTFTQNRDVTSFQEGEIVKLGGVEVGNLDGFSLNFRSETFTNINIESLTINAPAPGSTDAVFRATINGEEYISTSGVGNQIGTNTAITLQSLSNPNRVLTLQTGNTGIANAANTALDLSTQTNADAIAKEIQDAIGLTGAGARLSFQVGASSADALGVQISSVKTSTLYDAKQLSVDTQANAAIASEQLDIALNTVVTTRAQVGALQSRFDFASANVQASLQNQDAARGVLLDTDVTAESTAYAISQVQLQAGIAVLAQANQLPQNLLKLLQ